MWEVKCTNCKGTGICYGGPGNYPYTCPKCGGKKVTPPDRPDIPPLSTDH